MFKIVNIIKSKRIPISIMLSSFLMIGCQDSYLNQAKKLSENSAKLEELFNQQANDYIESCFRKADYTLIKPRDANIFNDREKNRADCNDGKREQRKSFFIAQNKIFSTYL